MSHNLYEDEYLGIRQFMAQIFPEPTKLRLMVPAEVQAQELERIRIGCRAEQFAIVTNLLTLSVEKAFGLEEIGFADTTFSFRQYLRCMSNPGHLRSSILLSKQIFSLLSELPQMQFLKPRFIANIPMQKANGEILLVKRTLSPWQYTSTGLITEYLSEFQIIKPYEGEPMSPRFLDVPTHLKANFYKAVYQIFANLSAQKNPFTLRELDLMRIYISQPARKRPSSQFIADYTNLRVLTVKEYNKSILAKAKGLYGEDLPVETAFDVAIFLHKNGLLPPQNP
ncbi:hypothetical protein [Spirosoma sp.]|uniref:hypothetical protein n=1 Tax=Spirosoma sp. TaxID=1899569 RepID=UPI002602F2A4|nr:hypothetical protein [Spirosoma sp.]MCX6212827.1 hypothetical protein [Spirosoma sp.]